MTGMKLQAPTSKLQRSSKRQAPILAGGIMEYPAVLNGAFEMNDAPPEGRHPFDLEERTARFGEAIILFCKKIPLGPGNNRLIDQLIGCATSIGANYCEAYEGVSKKDFRNIIGHCVKEAKETKFFLRMIATSEPKVADEARKLYREAKEPHLIFASIFRK
jgi:four helix bundle protein